MFAASIDILTTARLRLVPATPGQIRAMIDRDYPSASTLLGSSVPDGWPDDADAREGLLWHLSAIEKNPAERLWRVRFVIEKASNALIGAINLKGLPSADGDVEIGWGIAPGARRRGYATKASIAVMTWTFASERVASVSATVPEDNAASQRVAERLGMQRTGETQRGLPLRAVTRARDRAARP